MSDMALKCDDADTRSGSEAVVIVPFELVVDEDDLWLLLLCCLDLVAEATLALTPLARLLNKSIFAAVLFFIFACFSFYRFD